MNEKQTSLLLGQLREGRAVIVYARLGMGKTTFIKKVVRDSGLELVEHDVTVFDKDEWDELCDMVGNSNSGIVVYIPTIDSIEESRLVKLVRANGNTPIIMETSKGWGFKDLRAYCKEIALDVPDWRTLRDIMIQRGTYKGIQPQNLYHAYGDGSFVRVETDYGLTAKFFNGEFIEVTENFLPWIIDNAPNFLNGYDLYVLLEYAAKIAATGNVSFISGLAQKGKGSVERPYYFRKMGLVRNGEGEA